MFIIEAVLSPLTWVMGLLLLSIYQVVSSYGVAIIGLSLVVKLVTLPIASIAMRAEKRDRAAQLAMAPALADARKRLSGRKGFERMEEIYAEHNYHPIQSVVSLLPIGLQLPFLLSVLFLLVHNPTLTGESFLFIRDLGQPDGLLPLGFLAPGLTLNILPIMITVLALLESLIKPDLTRAIRLRFLIVATVIAVLIYPLPAGVCLYWLASNFWSLARTVFVSVVDVGTGKSDER